MKFDSILKQLRADRHLSAKDLSALLGYSKNIIYEWEHGRAQPTYETLVKISKIFNVSTDYLLGIEDDFGNYVTPANTFSDLSSEELAIIKKLRVLDPRHRDLVKSQIETLAELSSQKTK